MKNNSPSPVAKFIDFLTTDIWRIRASKLSGRKSFWIRQLRTILLAIRGFGEDQCQLRASALTFYSLLSVVPVVAMAFGIAKGFNMDKLLEERILESLQGQEEVATRIIEFSHSFLENTQGGLIAGVGIAVLFWTIIKMLGNIESSFNDIWGIKKSRSFGRKFSDYLSIMLICPILLIMSSSITVIIASQVTMIMDKLSFLGPVADAIVFSLKILPYAVLWGVFTFVYMFMPNTAVKFRSAFVAGIIAGTIYQGVQWAYINFQVGVSKYGAIYGSFAALPLFLMWLQVSWLIVLFGAEVSFAEQNVETYEYEPDCLKVSHSFKRLLALSIVHLCVKKFHHAQEPLTADDIAHELEMPIRLAREVLYDLTESGVLSEVKINDSKVSAYQPASDIEDFTLFHIVNKLDQYGIDNIPIAETEDVKKLKKSLGAFHDVIRQAPSNISLKSLS